MAHPTLTREVVLFLRSSYANTSPLRPSAGPWYTGSRACAKWGWPTSLLAGGTSPFVCGHATRQDCRGDQQPAQTLGRDICGDTYGHWGTHAAARGANDDDQSCRHGT